MTDATSTPLTASGSLHRLPAAKSLFSQHYLQTRLPEHTEWSADPWPVFEAVRQLWERARALGGTWNEAQTEQEFVKPVLEALGWSYIVQVKAQRRGGSLTRPDYALFSDPAAQAQAYPHQGNDDAFYGRTVAIAEAKYWGRPLSATDASGRNTWKAESNPSHQMVSYLVGTRCPWGILTNGRAWRLYSREVSSTASEFYEVDLGLIFDALLPLASQERGSRGEVGNPTPEQLADFKRWWLFFRRDAFLPDSHGRSFVQQVREGSATYAKRVSDKLKELVFAEVMPEIANGFVAYRREQLGIRTETDASLREIYAAALSLLYKLLFVLYAEARDLLPMRSTGYREQSVTALAEWAAARIDAHSPFSETTFATPRYDALLALFRRIDRGDPSLGIPRYDGGLFSAATPENRFLERHKLSDRAVARAVDIMVRDAGEPVDYAYISVRNLGTIYEGLLENRLVVAAAELPSLRRDGNSAAVLVNDRGERKLSGSFYTPDFIVEYIVGQTLDPILDERGLRFTAAMDRSAGLHRQLSHALDRTTNLRLQADLDRAEREALEAFLGIKCCDPAMGSGHFLVNAVDHLTDGIIRRMQVYHDTHPGVPWEWNPVQRLIERVRREILDEMARQGIAIDPARLDDTALLTRLVMKRCIYGVDLNPLAVELAKLSLWLHSFTIGAPLSFLDHHLRWGNSVIGADVRTVERAMKVTDAGQFALFQGPFAGLLDLTAVMIEVAERADATLADVQQSAEAYAAFQRQLLPYKQALDLWVSQWFGDGRPLTDDGRPRAEGAVTPAPQQSILSGTKRRGRSKVEGCAAVEFMTMHSADVLPALRGEIVVDERYQGAIARARGLWEQQRFFHWDLEFPEVFIDLAGRDWAVDGGFDAMIGNPPYVRQEQVSAAKRYLAAAHAPVYDAAADLYVYFYHRGCEMLRRGGRLAYIVSNKWLRAGYGEPLRRYLAEEIVVERIVDFGHSPIFPDADTFPCIAVLSKPDTEPAAPAETEVCAFPREELGRSDLRDYVEAHSHRVPTGRFSAAPWSLEPAETEDLVEKIRHVGAPLSEFVGARPYRGLLTGLNEAFLIDTATRDGLVAQDPRCTEIIKPYLRGQDVKRWTPEWAGMWMILLKSSENQAWPWSKAGDSAESAFAQVFPSVYAHLKAFEDALRKRQDRGRFWWELRSCAYYDAFERPKLLYQEIQFHPAYCLETEGYHSNNKTFLVPTADLWLLAVLNSPLMWWYTWRYLPHMKDEALSPVAELMEKLPIAAPSEIVRSQVEVAVRQLIALRKQSQASAREVLSWLAAEFGVTTPGQALEAFADLDEAAFIQQVRARRPKGEARLNPAAVGELARVYRQYVPPLRAGSAESARLESRLAEMVNAAYGLTPDEVALLWRTAPPRMPVGTGARS